MAIDFKLGDFLYPGALLRFRSFLERSQWFSAEQLAEYQRHRLRVVLDHAYAAVPYYRALFDRLKLRPADIRSLEDLKRIPPLTKKDLRENFDAIKARDADRFRPALCKTSGTFGEPVACLQDKTSNVLEFCYYWRYWSWAGYKLGKPFADLSLRPFLASDVDRVVDYQPLTRRLLLNPAQVSASNLDAMIRAMRRHEVRFLKGSPSSVHALSLLLRAAGGSPPPLDGVFTTGELLLAHQRATIESTFRCHVLDSYGHQERTIAICQCPSGTYHLNSEYGILELEDNGRVLGTSLHNLAMPLIRYEVRDYIELAGAASCCPCGRKLPAVKAIHGRRQDAILTPDGRHVTNAFVVFEAIRGVDWFQMIQDERDSLKVELVPGAGYDAAQEAKLLNLLGGLLGSSMSCSIAYREAPELRAGEKFRSVVSRLALSGEAVP